MTPPRDWNPAKAIVRCPAGPWQGQCWRGHNRLYPAGSYEGSRRFSGRFHRAADCSASGTVWPALYLAFAESTAILEVARQYEAGDWPPKNRRFTKLRVRLERVIDCSNPALLALALEDLLKEPDDHDRDPCHHEAWETPRRVAEAALGQGAEAIIVPSATRRGNNLIVFPDNLSAASAIEVTDEYFEPRWSRQPA